MVRALKTSCLLFTEGRGDWEGQFRAAIDGDRAREIHLQNKVGTCSMCGKYCAILIMESYLK